MPLPAGTALPLPLGFGPDKPNDRLVVAFRDDIEAYLAREVLPHVPDAWIDYNKTKVGYEIPLNRHFYVYQPPRPLEEIEADIKKLEGGDRGTAEGVGGMSGSALPSMSPGYEPAAVHVAFCRSTG